MRDDTLDHFGAPLFGRPTTYFFQTHQSTCNHYPFTFDWNHHIIFKAAKVTGISGRNLWQTWYQLRGLLRAGAVDLAPLVTHHFDLEDYEQAFDVMLSGNSGKVVLYP